MGVTRVDQLSEEEKARFNEWADRWIDIGLRTGPADREKFEASVRDCYRFAGFEFPDVVVWVPSPMVLAFAAPAAAVAIELIEAVNRHSPRGAVRGAVHDAVGDAVHDAVGDAVRGAVGGAVHGAVGDAVRGAVGGAVHGAVDGAVRGAVRDAVHDAVDGAVDGAVRGAVRDAVGDAVHGAVGDAVGGAVHDDEIGQAVLSAIGRSWHRYFGGQLWPGGWYWGGAFTSFFREVCDLELPGNLWDRGRAYEGTIESACWWWPHRRFVMVCERPLEIHRELVLESQSRGWGSHRLHCEDGPAVVWPDGWGVWSIHGTRVSRKVVEAPETLTAAEILGEENAEVRRVMIDRFGPERLLDEADAQVLDEVHEPPFPGLLDAKLYRLDVSDDEPIVMVKCRNSSPEPDGSFKDYWLRVDPGCCTAHEALAWTWGMDVNEYRPLIET